MTINKYQLKIFLVSVIILLGFMCLPKINSAQTIPAQILPIHLLSFTGIRDKENIILKWSTASEINNGHYLVERSIDALNWIIVCAIRVTENSSVMKNYSFTDKVFFNEPAYYQIRQSDFEQKFDYSNIIEVKNTEEVLTDFKK